MIPADKRNNPTYILAYLIREAVNIHEASYDQDAADLATAEFSNRARMDPVDYNQFYGLKLNEAVDKAVATLQVQMPEMEIAALSQPVYFLLFGTWNDACDWAREVLDGPADQQPSTEA